MTARVCYVERTARGAALVRLRLVTPRAEEVWSIPAPEGDDREAIVRTLRGAAEWLRDRLREATTSRLEALVLDTDGSLCSWLSASGSEAAAVAAIVRQSGAGDDSDSPAGAAPIQLSLSPDAPILGGASVEALPDGVSGDEPPARPALKRRLAVLSVADASTRLLLDELDNAGIEVRRVMTLWHALAEAFGSRPPTPGEIAPQPDGTRGAAVVDRAGRLVWAWSRGTCLAAAGSMRLPRPDALPEACPRLAPHDLGRLATDWIGWSAQLAASPASWVMVLPQAAWSEEAPLGESVSGVWPGATADILLDDDPVGLALTRLAGAIDDTGGGRRAAPGAALEGLSNRPGRPHRLMYLAAAAAVGMAAIATGAAAWRVQDAASEARVEARKLRTQWRDQATGIHAPASEITVRDNEVVFLLQDELDRRRKALMPAQNEPDMPVLEELEALSFVLGNPDYQLERLSVTSYNVLIEVVVPDTPAFEELLESLPRIGGSRIATWTSEVRELGGQGVRCTFTGLWRTEPRPVGGST